jgi:Leucine-rich repeat (LRR) protein
VSCLQGLDSLTAINLERNLIQNIASDAFAGVADTLSSLSLLNNLLTDFPTPAISTLKELRVSDAFAFALFLLTPMQMRKHKFSRRITISSLIAKAVRRLAHSANKKVKTIIGHDLNRERR